MSDNSMSRRQLLQSIGISAVGAILAGCAGNGTGGDGPSVQTDSPTDTSTPTEGTPMETETTDSGATETTEPATTETTAAETTTGSPTPTETSTATQTSTPGNGDLALSSSAFADGESIPTEYTCDGENVSPPLSIEGVSGAAQSLALIMDDPDAGEEPFVHWLLWNLPVDTTQIPRAVPQNETVDDLGGAVQGTNGAGNIGYAGPCPPSGEHTYRFRLFTLDSTLDLNAGATRSELESAMEESVLTQTTLTGTYQSG